MNEIVFTDIQRRKLQFIFKNCLPKSEVQKYYNVINLQKKFKCPHLANFLKKELNRIKTTEEYKKIESKIYD